MVADGLVDLEDHLIRIEQQIHHAGRTIGRRQQSQRFLGQRPPQGVETRIVKKLKSLLTAV